MSDKLTPKQELFCLEYMKDLNITQAATRAGYSAKTARVIGQETLLKPAVQARLDELLAERSAKVQIDAEWVLRELVKQYGKADETGDISVALSALEKTGKHVGVQAFRDRLDLTSSDGSMTPTVIERVIVANSEDA